MENLELSETEENSNNLVTETVSYTPATQLKEEKTELPDLDKAYQDNPEQGNKKAMLDAAKNWFIILTNQNKSSQTRFSYVKTTAELFVWDWVSWEWSKIFIVDGTGNQTKKNVYNLFTDMAAKWTKYNILDDKTEWWEPEIEMGINGNTWNMEEKKHYRIKTLYVTLAQ